MNKIFTMSQLSITMYLLWLVIMMTGFGCTSTRQSAIVQENNETNEQLELNDFSKLSFRTYKTGHLRIDGKIDRHLVRLIIDTGSSKSFIESRYVQMLDIPIELSNETASGIGGRSTQLSFSKIALLDFEGFTIRNWLFGVMNLNHINRALINAGVESVDGIIGADLLRHYDCIIDYKNEIIYFKNGTPWSDDRG